MSRRLGNESGQALVLTAVFLVFIMGATGLAVDVGSWYRQSRQAQTTADAAALSGAEQLGEGTADPVSAATTTAQSYADQNGGGIGAGGITFSSAFTPNDTVSVKVIQTAPSFFTRLFGIDSVNVHAHASARIAVPSEVIGAAPIVVQQSHPMLTGAGCGNPTSPPTPCFGPSNETSIPLGKDGAPGSFGIVDLSAFTATGSDGNCDGSTAGGNAGSSTIGSWITSGFNAYLDLGCYDSDPGAKFNSANIESALSGRLGATLLFPVYSTLTGNGSNAQYDIIGWAAYTVTGWATGNDSDSIPPTTCSDPGGSGNGTTGAVCGYFTQVTWAGIQSSSAPTDPNYGVNSVSLVN